MAKLSPPISSGSIGTISDSNQRLTPYCIISGILIALAPFQFGYKMSELNNPKDAIMSCDLDSNIGKILGLPVCLPMSDSYFGLVTSIFAIGGLMGSFIGGHFSGIYGRKKYLVFNSFIYFIGSALEFFSVNPQMLAFSRFCSGIAAGAALVIAPVFLTEIAPIKSRGFLNIFSQMLIVVGSFCAQIIGYFFRTGNQWRYVILFGVAFSLINGVSMLFVLESPKFLASKGRFPEARYVLSRLRGTDDVEAELMSWDPISYATSTSNVAEGSGVFVDSELSDIDTSKKNKKTDLRTVLKMKKYRQPLVLVFLLQTAQQLSGINTVTFYSNAIFSKMFDSNTSSILTLTVGATNMKKVPFLFNDHYARQLSSPYHIPADDVEAELMSWDPISYATSTSNVAEGSGVFVDSELSDIDTSKKNKKTDLRTVLKMKKYRQPLVLVFLLQTAQQLSGINTVTFYSNAIFSKMFDSNTSSILTLTVGATNMVFTFISIFVIDRVKRRKFLFFSMITMLVSLALLTISLLVKIDYLSVVSIYLVQITFIFGLAPLPFLIATEIFDQQGMSAGNSVSIASNWLWTFVIGIAFLPLQEVVGSYIFIIFMACLAVTFIFFYFFLPESKDKTYESIEKEFKF
ncbi:putative metabolite transport protein [Smittium culicis]|uniref:Putative metabolite transport protein n=1 Tax=Smittium culicis TaxID=133412 RepID=A0A1R1YJ58_9FUNG|nr:putative metabolite transport protein [Smittium culicis]